MRVVCITGAGDKPAPDITTSLIYGSASALRERGMAEIYSSQAKRRFTLTLVLADYRPGDAMTMRLDGETVQALITGVEHLAFGARAVSRVTCEAIT